MVAMAGKPISSASNTAALLRQLDLQEVPCIRYPQQTLLHLIPSHAARSGFARAADVNALMAVDGEVWGGVGNFVVKWGRRA